MTMYIVSTGMVCSVGLSAAAACAAIRAGISGFDELPYLDNQGEPIVGAMVPGLDPKLKRDERLIEMLSMALKDCLNKRPGLNTAQTPLIVGLAEPGRPGGGAGFADKVIASVQESLAVQFHPHYSRTISSGHTSGFEALQICRELHNVDPSVNKSLVCGVDTYLSAATLLWLDENLRLKRDGESDGVIPGEAAAAVLLDHSTHQKTDPCTQVAGLGFGHEPANVLSEKPLLGKGLADAVSQTLAQVDYEMQEIDFRVSDVTGESYGFKEHALMFSRIQKKTRKESQIWHCADVIGDTGAAAGLCELIIAAHAFQGGFAPGVRTICFTSAVGGDRAVALLNF